MKGEEEADQDVAHDEQVERQPLIEKGDQRDLRRQLDSVSQELTASVNRIAEKDTSLKQATSEIQQLLSTSL